MKRVMTLASVVAAALVVTVVPAAAGGKLKCFAGAPGVCTINASTNGAYLDTTNGGYAGVYYSNGKSLSGSSLASVDFSFEYRCQPSNTDVTTCVAGGAPRWSIPIDTDGVRKTVEGYAFLDANSCGRTGVVSTAVPTCLVFFGSDMYANWDAFAATHPTYTIASALPFVIVDVQTASPINVYGVEIARS